MYVTEFHCISNFWLQVQNLVAHEKHARIPVPYKVCDTVLAVGTKNNWVREFENIRIRNFYAYENFCGYRYLWITTKSVDQRRGIPSAEFSSAVLPRRDQLFPSCLHVPAALLSRTDPEQKNDKLRKPCWKRSFEYWVSNQECSDEDCSPRVNLIVTI